MLEETDCWRVLKIAVSAVCVCVCGQERVCLFAVRGGMGREGKVFLGMCHFST